MTSSGSDISLAEVWGLVRECYNQVMLQRSILEEQSFNAESTDDTAGRRCRDRWKGEQAKSDVKTGAKQRRAQILRSSFSLLDAPPDGSTPHPPGRREHCSGLPLR